MKFFIDASLPPDMLKTMLNGQKFNSYELKAMTIVVALKEMKKEVNAEEFLLLSKDLKLTAFYMKLLNSL